MNLPIVEAHGRTPVPPPADEANGCANGHWCWNHQCMRCGAAC